MGVWLNVDKKLARKQLKGTAEHDSDLKLLCQIRHEFTNYDKLVTFYGIFPERRSELNATIRKLIDNGPDYIEQFKQKVKHIENSVNLNLKEVKKRFLQKEEQRLRESNPLCKDKNIKEWALNNLNDAIRINNKNIIKQKEYKHEKDTGKNK